MKINRQIDPLLNEVYISLERYLFEILWHKISKKWIGGDDLILLKKNEQLHFI